MDLSVDPLDMPEDTIEQMEEKRSLCALRAIHWVDVAKKLPADLTGSQANALLLIQSASLGCVVKSWELERKLFAEEHQVTNLYKFINQFGEADTDEADIEAEDLFSFVEGQFLKMDSFVKLWGKSTPLAHPVKRRSLESYMNTEQSNSSESLSDAPPQRLKEAMEEVLKTLTYKERQIIKERYGTEG